LGDELLALVDEAKKNGERGRQVSGRFDQGQLLVAELFGVQSRARGPIGSPDTVVTWGGRLREVTIGGRIVIRNDTLVSADTDRIRHEAEAAARTLWLRMR
jgi:hypothetical protein